MNEEGYLLIDKAGLEDEDTGIRTKKGDQVLAVDTRNGIIICKVTGKAMWDGWLWCGTLPRWSGSGPQLRQRGVSGGRHRRKSGMQCF